MHPHKNTRSQLQVPLMTHKRVGSRRLRPRAPQTPTRSGCRAPAAGRASPPGLHKSKQGWVGKRTATRWPDGVCRAQAVGHRAPIDRACRHGESAACCSASCRCCPQLLRYSWRQGGGRWRARADASRGTLLPNVGAVAKLWVLLSRGSSSVARCMQPQAMCLHMSRCHAAHLPKGRQLCQI